MGRRQQLRRGIGVSLGVLAVLVGATAVAFGGQLPGASPHRRSPSTTSTTVPYAGPQRYELWGTVVDERGRAPELCRGVLESLPPQCAEGVLLHGWDWHAVGGGYSIEQDVRWGPFHVVGTLGPDGELTLTQPADHDPAPAGRAVGTLHRYRG